MDEKSKMYKHKIEIKFDEDLIDTSRGIDIRFLSDLLYYFKAISSYYHEKYEDIEDIEDIEFKMKMQNLIREIERLVKEGGGFKIEADENYIIIRLYNEIIRLYNEDILLHYYYNDYYFKSEKLAINIILIKKGSLSLEFVSTAEIALILLSLSLAIKILLSKNININFGLKISEDSIELNIGIDNSPNNNIKGPGL